MAAHRWLVALLASLALAGCATMSPRTPYSAADSIRASPLPHEQVRLWATGDDAAYGRWRRSLLADRAAHGLASPRTLLALSGGSDKGAFGAGVLTAWTRAGNRPAFDIVTGVSTGALIAPFAFLGPDEDSTLTEIYTGISSKDIYRKRFLSGLLGGPSLLDSKPLAALIARHVTPAFLDRIAAQHRRGRRLLVMTTQLDAQRGVIWDMGAIAASSSPRRLTLFRKVLLASASIPGVFPPVLIDATVDGHEISEMHVDGGAIAGFFSLPSAMIESATPGSRPNAAIYLVYNGVFAPDFALVKPRTFSIISQALSTVLGELDRNNAGNLQAVAAQHHVPFYLCALAPTEVNRKAPLFDRANMRALYAIGERRVRSDGCLQHPIAR